MFINGLSWWWKILPYPSLHAISSPQTPHIVQAMIDTGYMFALIKVIEVVAGVALLANAWVALTLVIAFPVTLAAWSVDAFILSSSLRANVLGWGTLLPHSFLLLAYLRCYQPMMALRTGTIFAGSNQPDRNIAASSFREHPTTRSAIAAFGVIAAIAALWAVVWLFVMIVSRLA